MTNIPINWLFLWVLDTWPPLCDFYSVVGTSSLLFYHVFMHNVAFPRPEMFRRTLARWESHFLLSSSSSPTFLRLCPPLLPSYSRALASSFRNKISRPRSGQHKSQQLCFIKGTGGVVLVNFFLTSQLVVCSLYFYVVRVFQQETRLSKPLTSSKGRRKQRGVYHFAGES